MRNPKLYVAAVTFAALSCFGCQCTGGTINVNGLPEDTIFLQKSNIHPGGCCGGPLGPVCFGNCVDAAPVILDGNGMGSHSYLTSDDTWFGLSPFTGSQGTAILPCEGTATMNCVTFGPPVPQGQITITGPGITSVQVCDPDLECPPRPPRTVYNHTTIYATINGTTVSASASNGSTANSVAFALANAINGSPVLGPQFVAVSSNNVVYVQAGQSGYLEYAWEQSCTYNTTYFSDCGYSETLSPERTMLTKSN